MTSFKLNHIEAFRDLRSDTSFTDVFLTCGHNVIPAHRVILSSCSKYFRRVLSLTSQASVTNYCVLDGASEHLIAIVIQFIYAGFVDLPHEDVEHFVALCRKLEILGFEAVEVFDPLSPSDNFDEKLDEDSVKDEPLTDIEDDLPKNESEEMVQELDPFVTIPFVENGLPFSEPSTSALSEHASSESSLDDAYRTQCSRCLKQFTTAYTRMQHEKYNCSTLSPEERRQNKAKNSCHRCSTGFLTPKLLRKHLRQNCCGNFPKIAEKPHHCGKPPPDEEIQREVAVNIIKVGNRDDGFRWKCGFCGKKYCASWVCKNHIEIAHMSEPQVFSCSTCAAKFRWKSSLNKHRRESCPAKIRGIVTHPSQPSFPCPKCSLTFRWKFALDKHQARCFTDGKGFSCRKCGRRCLSKVGLKQHEKYFCSVAQTMSRALKPSDKPATPDLLPISKLTVTKTAAMPGHQGASMINLKLEKDISKKPEVEENAMDQLEQAPVSKEKVESYIIKLSTSEERRWMCKECSFVFKSKYTLEQHIETQHLHVKFSCKYCQSTYTRRYNLLNHQVTCRANQAAASAE